MVDTTASQETLAKIKEFEAADLEFRKEWEEFENTHRAHLERIEKLRDSRNAKLDEAKRSLRADTERLGASVMRTSFSTGPFKVQKKWSDFYIPEKLVSMLADRGLYDQALSSGIVAVKTEVEKYAVVKKFLEDNGIALDFECCEDGKPDSISISGPKSIPPLGSELKKE